MNIYIIRHGETSSNKNGEYYGSLDIPLNKNGRLQMKALRAPLASLEVTRVYSSPSSRALESLKLCGDHLYDMVEIDSRLGELDFGEFEGKTYEEIEALYPEETKAWGRDWKSFCPPGGESFISFYHKVKAFFKELLTLQEENILIMAHSGVIKAIYAYVLQDNPDLYWHFTCHNGKINVIKYEYDNLFIDGINKGAL